MNISTPSDTELSIQRTFDAPRAKVFAAITTPETIRHWLSGPPGWTMTECALEPKAGTAYRFAWRNGDNGPTMGLGGTVTEAVVPERLVATEKFDESWYPGEARISQSLSEADGKTTLTITMRYPAKDVRDGVLNSGMTTGMQMNYDRLAALLAA
jgi:uncharacterized protein YndB with AHSA1/START domain